MIIEEEETPIYYSYSWAKLCFAMHDCIIAKYSLPYSRQCVDHAYIATACRYEIYRFEYWSRLKLWSATHFNRRITSPHRQYHAELAANFAMGALRQLTDFFIESYFNSSSPRFDFLSQIILFVFQITAPFSSIWHRYGTPELSASLPASRTRKRQMYRRFNFFVKSELASAKLQVALRILSSFVWEISMRRARRVIALTCDILISPFDAPLISFASRTRAPMFIGSRANRLPRQKQQWIY